MSPSRLLGIVASVFVLLATGLQTSPALAGIQTCNGLRATIVSSAATVFGTSGRDVIVVRGSGDHLVKALAGNDTICASPGVDTILAGAGDDLVISGAGNDEVHGGAGNDVINAGNGDDLVTGGSGADRLRGGAGSDSMQGGAAVDKLNTGPGQNICADDPADTVAGKCQVDSLAPALQVEMTNYEFTAGTDFTLTFRVSDPAGVAVTTVFIGNQSGWVTEWCGFGQPGQLVSGNNQDGVYQMNCPIPATAVSQSYTAFIHATDAFSMKTETVQFDFIVVGGVGDATAPTFQSGYAESSTVRNGDVFSLYYTVSDTSGVGWVVGFLMLKGGGFADSSGRGYTAWGGMPLRVSGDMQSGTYRQEFVLNEFAPSGEYTLWLSMRDIYGNKEFVQTDVTFFSTGAIITG